MYEFKIGDEVEVVRDTVVQKGRKFLVDEIIFEPGDIEPLLYGTNSDGGWFPSSLKLVCPAGYRPVREDEMDEVPCYGDAWFDGDLNTVCSPFSTTFGSYAGDGEPWFRPLTTEPVKAEPTVEEAPVVKEDNNWGWMVVQTGAVHAWDTDMRETEAKAAAMRYSKDYQRTTLVFKVMGEYSTTCTTKWTSAGE